ncbi:hypothetical protein RhiirA5_418396 [Rhizophagus irregularis]|uniref:Uncharacterized protein n=1 Tax=Rhizophagus irregularis TaxID=588596 RepID=A0A2N0PKF1_9GLOM|nr:hypothetical protein RhiirA5_418396 [Rhizophagus irregularis]
MKESTPQRFCDFIKDFEFDYLSIPPEKAWENLENAYTFYLNNISEQEVSDETRELVKRFQQQWTSIKNRTKNNFTNTYLQLRERLAERKVQAISRDVACRTISANVEKVEKNVIIWIKTDDSDNSQNSFAVSENERKGPVEEVPHTITISQNIRTHTHPPRDSTLDSNNDPKLELSADAPETQRPQASDLSYASMSHEIEAETDVFNSENNEDSETIDLDTPDHEEAIDNKEEVKREGNNKEVAKENQNGPFRMREQNRMEFIKSYRAMNESYMWKLSSGRIVEEELFKLGTDLEFEHAIHSFILDVEDELIMEHFTEEELKEIEGTTIPKIPDLSDEIDDFLGKFLGKTNLNKIRQIIKESMFGNDYNREKHHDVDYICLALYSLVREIENGNLKNANLENWYNCHVWNIIFDQAFGDVQAVTVVRGESTSVSTATRKNKQAKRKPGERRRIGRRGDWILRAVGNGNKDEFGVGEAGKDWTDIYGTKYLKEIGLKLPKTLKDMLMVLMERVNWVKDVRKNIQTVGIIHEGLMMSLVYADNPKGYICRMRRSNLMEVPDTAEKFDSILTILASILTAKSAIQMTIEMAQTKRQAVKSSFKGAGYRKRPREEDQHQMPACLSTPKKIKRCAKVNDKRPYPSSPCPGSPSFDPLI